MVGDRRSRFGPSRFSTGGRGGDSADRRSRPAVGAGDDGSVGRHFGPPSGEKGFSGSPGDRAGAEALSVALLPPGQGGGAFRGSRPSQGDPGGGPLDRRSGSRKALGPSRRPTSLPRGRRGRILIEGLASPEPTMQILPMSRLTFFGLALLLPGLYYTIRFGSGF